MKPAILIEDLLTLALGAGRRILDIYRTEFTVHHKADASPVTAADIAAHEYILAGLAELTPELPVLSEESDEVPYATRRHWSRYWLVDPLDGTREFAQRNGMFTVNIALIEDGLPVLGVVHAPVAGSTWFGAEGLGAYVLSGDQRHRLHTRPVPERPVFVASRSHRDARLEAVLRAAPAHQEISVGSSLKFCRIAAGEADFYPRTGSISEWDSAAGQAVLEQAGGQVLSLPGRARMRYNTGESLLTPRFAALGDPRHDWSALLELIEGPAA